MLLIKKKNEWNLILNRWKNKKFVIKYWKLVIIKRKRKKGNFRRKLLKANANCPRE